MGNRNNRATGSLLSSDQPLLVNEEVKSNIQSKTATIQEPFHMEQSSVCLSNEESLSFITSSTVETEISVYYGSREVINEECVTIGFESDAKFPAPIHFQAYPGLSMQSLVPLDLSLFVSENLEPTTYPVIIVLVSSIQKKPDDESIRENTYLRFVREGDAFVPKVLFQKLIFEGKSYELKDVFGTLNQEEPECDICKEFAKDTIVVPCQHMCLCSQCANIVRGQYDTKCPICRTQVRSLVTITID